MKENEDARDVHFEFDNLRTKKKPEIMRCSKMLNKLTILKFRQRVECEKSKSSFRIKKKRTENN